MNRNKKFNNILNNQNQNLPLLGYSVIIGLGAGLVTSLYRLVLTDLEKCRVVAYGFVAQHAFSTLILLTSMIAAVISDTEDFPEKI